MEGHEVSESVAGDKNTLHHRCDRTRGATRPGGTGGNRHNPARSELATALRAAGLTDRLALLERIPPAYGIGEEPAPSHRARGLYLAHAGVPRVEAEGLLTATLGKARLPEPHRVAHLIRQAIVLRESRGRV
jgi:hypothetical protein